MQCHVKSSFAQIGIGMYLTVLSASAAPLSRLRRDQITQAVRSVIAPNTILIRIHLEHILRPIRIVLQRRQSFHQPRTPLLDEEPRWQSFRRSPLGPYPGAPSTLGLEPSAAKCSGSRYGLSGKCRQVAPPALP
jgi:hypothetical protein